MSKCKELHQQSLQQYKTFYNLTLTMEKTLEQPDAEQIIGLTLELEKMQKAIRRTDAQLNRCFQGGHFPENSSCHITRLGLMQKIIEKNKALSPRVQAMMAMQASELTKIKQGQNTLGGYTDQASKAGRIIDTAN